MIKELLYKWFDLEPLPCQSCETLKMQLAIANHEKQELLNSILNINKPAEVSVAPVIEYEKIKPQTIAWNVRRQMLEAEDRKQASLIAERKKSQQILDEQKKNIENLEKELGIPVEEVKSDAEAIG